MPHEFLVFITWRTWASARSLDEELAGRLAEVLPRLAAMEQASILELAILPNHVHALIELSAITDVPRLVQRLKGASARFANRDGWSSRGKILRWEPRYDVRTVAPLGVPGVRAYLNDQAERHRLPLLARWSNTMGKAA